MAENPSEKPPDTRRVPKVTLPQPNCAKCGGTEFTSAARNFASTPGILVYCRKCGAVVGWGPARSDS
jgi:hypothetical protein